MLKLRLEMKTIEADFVVLVVINDLVGLSNCN